MAPGQSLTGRSAHLADEVVAMIESVTATRRGRVVRSPDLGLEWIAEGVEGTHARDGLRALGCRYGHGSRTAGTNGVTAVTSEFAVARVRM